MPAPPTCCPGCGDEIPESMRHMQGRQRQHGVQVTSWVLSCPGCGAYGIGHQEDA